MTTNHLLSGLNGGHSKQPKKHSKAVDHSTRHINRTRQRALSLIALGQYQKVLDLIGGSQNDLALRNASGVCLMRLGRFDEAVRLYRSMVLQPGCTWTRVTIPDVYKVNFALALLLAGHPAGCLDMLDEINGDRSPAVQRVRSAISRWERNLSIWTRLDWKLFRVEPKQHHPVSLDFEPGELEQDLTALAA